MPPKYVNYASNAIFEPSLTLIHASAILLELDGVPKAMTGLPVLNEFGATKKRQPAAESFRNRPNQTDNRATANSKTKNKHNTNNETEKQRTL